MKYKSDIQFIQLLTLLCYSSSVLLESILLIFPVNNTSEMHGIVGASVSESLGISHPWLCMCKAKLLGIATC